MAVFIGNKSVQSIMIGHKNVQAIYIGRKLVYSSSVEPVVSVFRGKTEEPNHKFVFTINGKKFEIVSDGNGDFVYETKSVIYSIANLCTDPVVTLIDFSDVDLERCVDFRQILGIRKCPNTDIVGMRITDSRVVSMDCMFYGTGVTTIPDWSNVMARGESDIFYSNEKLTTIEGLPQMMKGDRSNNNLGANKSLTTIKKSGIILTSLNLSASPLTLESANVIIDALRPVIPQARVVFDNTTIGNKNVRFNVEGDFFVEEGKSFYMMLPQSVNDIVLPEGVKNEWFCVYGYDENNKQLLFAHVSNKSTGNIATESAQSHEGKLHHILIRFNLSQTQYTLADGEVSFSNYPMIGSQYISFSNATKALVLNSPSTLAKISEKETQGWVFTEITN